MPFAARSFLTLALALLSLATDVGAETGYDWIVEPRFEDAGAVHQGVTPLQEGGLWGLMGRDGQWIVPPEYEAVGTSGAGRFPLAKGGKWGVLDLAGQIVTPFEFDAIGKPDVYTPMKWQGQWWAIGPTGQADETPLPFDTLVGNDESCMVGTANGVPVAVHRGEEPSTFTPEGATAMRRPSGGIVPAQIGGFAGHVECAYGVVKNGQALFAEVRNFSEDLAGARAADGEFWGFIGRWDSYFEIPDTFLAVGDFAGGLAAVQDGSGLWGYIRRDGTYAIAPQFEQAFGFSDGLAGVVIGGKRGFVTEDGQLAVPAEFDDFWRHEGGVVPVEKDGKWGLIAPKATDPTQRFDLPLAQIAEMQKARVPGFALQPSNPHYYFFQDIASLHAIALSPDQKTMVTTLALDNEAELALWDMQSQRLIRKFRLPQATQAMLLPKAEVLAVGLSTGHLLLIDAVTGEELKRIRPHRNAIIDMDLSPDGAWLATADTETVQVWNVTTGDALPPQPVKAHKVRFTEGSDGLFAGTRRGGLARIGLEGSVAVLAPEGPAIEYGDGPQPDAVSEMALSRQGVVVSLRTEQVQQADGFFQSVSFLDVTRPDGSRQEIALSDATNLNSILSLDVSPDGRSVAYSGVASEGEWEALLEIRDLANGSVTFSRKLSAAEGLSQTIPSVDRMAFTPDAKLIIAAMEGQGLTVFDPATDQVTAELAAPLTQAQGGAALLEGTDYLSTDGSGNVWIWDLAGGSLSGRVPVMEGGFGVEEMQEVRDGILYLYSGLDTGVVHAYDIANGTAISLTDAEQMALGETFTYGESAAGYPPEIEARIAALGGELAAVPLAGGRLVVTHEPVGIHHVSDLQSGEKLADFLSTPDGEWLILTTEGFFAASPKGARLVSVSSGLKAFSVDQVYQALYRPDLVAAKIAGDPDGLVAAAAAKLDLTQVIRSGAAPVTRFSFPVDGFASPEPEIEVEAVIEDEGGGIGRVEWRLNGLTVDVQPTRSATALAAEDTGFPAKARLALEPGENVIEVIAYNQAGLLASTPRQVVVKWDGVATSTPPVLHVLAVGVNDYADGRLRLNYAANDAKAFAEAMGKAGQGLFQSVNVVTLLDGEVTEAGLDAAFDQIGNVARPQDVFVFFLAGHGKTIDGMYHFIPQDFRFDGEDAVQTHGINQDRWQEWSARIKARKSVMIYDTCESGSLTGTRSLDAAMAQTAAVERLTRAMGRTILSASTDDAPALEGYKGHGVMTWALLDAIGRGDTNGNATIEITEIAGHLDLKVPEISASAFGFRQVPQMSIKGSDFALGAQVAVLGDEAPESFPSSLTHVVAGGTVVLDAPGGSEVQSIPDGVFFGVFRIEERDGFARIAKDGKALGWVAAASLAPLQ